MAIVSRLQLNHPTLGTAGGAGLHASIESLYTKIGDNMADRWFAIADFDQTEVVDLLHNFETDINNLRYDLYNFTGGEWVRLTAATSPARSAFSVIEKVGSEATTLQITNNTGGNNLTFAVGITFDSISLADSDIKDVDIVTTSPEDGQSLVWDSVSSKFKPGASGDSSFKLQGVTDPNVTIKGGYLLLDDGREIATYDGAGTAATDFGTDIVVNLDTVLGSNPANATTYYLYLDLLNLGSEVTIDNGRKVYSIAAADTSKFYLSTTKPEAINRAQYAVIGFIRSATSGTVWSGSGAAFGTVASKKHDNGPVAVNPVVYTLPKQAVGSVGSSGQVVAGHVLSEALSFQSGLSTKLSFYNLRSNVNDGTSNARNLLATDGTTSFTSTSILGESNLAATFGGANSLHSTDTFFNPNSKSFAVGGWFYAGTWANNTIFCQADSATDQSFILAIDSAAQINFAAFNSSASVADFTFISSPVAFGSNSWHHFAVTYDYSTGIVKGFLDGVVFFSGYIANFRTLTAGTKTFRIGGRYSTPASRLTGRVEEFFFIANQAINDEEIRKIYSAKITHSANVATAYQEWTANIYSKVATQDDQSWLVDKTDKDNLFVDFSGLGATDSVELMLKNTGLTPVIVSPVPPFDQTYTSAPTFPITHGQPVIPEVMIMQEISSGSWETITAEGLVAANSTTLTGSVSALFTNGATKVRIIAKSPQNDATGVKFATDTIGGLVTSYAPICKSTIKTVASANFTSADNDGYSTIYFSTGASNRTYTPPSAANNPGRRIKIIKSDSGAGSLNITGTVQGTPNPFVSSQYGVIEIESDGTNWVLLNLKDSGSFTATLVGVTGTVTATWYYSRSMNAVTLYTRGNTGGANSDFYIYFTKNGSSGTITINLPNSILCIAEQVWTSKMVVSYNDSGSPVSFVPCDAYVNTANLVIYRDIGVDTFGASTQSTLVATQVSYVIR